MSAANSLTKALVTPAAAALAEATKSLAGLTKSVFIDPNPDSVAYEQSKKLPRPGAMSVEDFTPTVDPSAADAITIPGNTLEVDKLKNVRFELSQEELRALHQNAEAFKSEQINEAVDEAIAYVEKQMLATLKTGAGYALETSGSNPFDSTGKLDVIARARGTLNAAGIPRRNRSFVLGPNSVQRYLSLDSVNRLNENQDPQLRREGLLGSEFGFAMRETINHASFTASSASGYATDGSADAGDLTIEVSGGSNDFKEGDVISIENANYQYVVSDWESTTGIITLNAPLLEDIADSMDVTVETSDNRDFALSQRALWLLLRPDSLSEADLRTDNTTTVQDPNTGLRMRLSMIPGLGVTQFQLSFVMGSTIWYPQASCISYGN